MKEASKLCRSCGACCKINWIYTTSPDRAKRFSWLMTDKIEVKEIVTDKLWKIIFKYPCKYLHYDSKTNLYSCKTYGNARPNFCEEYPWNFNDKSLPAYDEEKNFCPLLGREE